MGHTRVVKNSAGTEVGRGMGSAAARALADSCGGIVTHEHPFPGDTIPVAKPEPKRAPRKPAKKKATKKKAAKKKKKKARR